MRILRLSFLFSLLSALTLATTAAKLASVYVETVSGRWTFEIPGAWAAKMQQMTLLLNQVGNDVDGTISSRVDAGSGSPSNTEILDGKVKNDILTFYVWTGRDRPVKAYYKGILSSDEIKFTVTGGARRAGRLRWSWQRRKSEWSATVHSKESEVRAGNRLSARPAEVILLSENSRERIEIGSGLLHSLTPCSHHKATCLKRALPTFASPLSLTGFENRRSQAKEDSHAQTSFSAAIESRNLGGRRRDVAEDPGERRQTVSR